MKCRICNKQTRLYEKINKVARQVSILKNNPFIDKGVNIDMFLCDDCNHFQIEYINNKDYYDEYIMIPHAESIYSFRERQINELFNLNSDSVSFIEIGCGDGGFLSHAAKKYKKVVGNEPSKIYSSLTKEKGFECIDDYITSEFIVTEKFDAFCAKQVFEHLPNPVDVLLKINDLLNEGGVGFIEIPNGAKTKYNNRYYDVFTDHVNYFTPTSLTKLAEKCGFVVINTKETFGGDYLECYMKKISNKNNIVIKRDNDFLFLKNNIKKYKNIGAYGAGAKGFSILTSIDYNLPLKYIFDDDPNKVGKYLPNTNIPVSETDINKINELDLIIIFAASYQEEIIYKLKTKFKYKGTIIGLQNKPELIEL